MTLTTTIKWFPALVAVLGLLCFSSFATAQTPAPAPAAPVKPVVASGAAPPAAPEKLAEGEGTGTAGAPGENDAPPEMKFGRSATPARGAPVTETPVVAPAAAVSTPGRARTMEDVSGAAMEELNIRRIRWRYSLNFFGDVSLSAGRPAGTDHQLGFAFGAQDLLIRGELSNNIVAATEIALEPDNQGITVDIERFYVRWQTPRFFAEAGRTHTGFGYWNNAYHHGRWLQPTIARPRWVAFEDDGGILPVHWVGAGVGARLPIGETTLNLMATVGNGRGHIVDDVRNAGDYQAMKAFHASAELVGVGRRELRVGVAGVFDRIPAWTGRALPPSGSIDEVIGSAHVAYVNVPLLLITEGYLVAHTAEGHQWTTYGGFAVIGYAFGPFTPYVEFERIASKGGADPFFTVTTAGIESGSFDTAEGIVGLRFDLSDWTALKAEYRQTRALDVNTTFHEGIVNWSWGF